MVASISCCRRIGSIPTFGMCDSLPVAAGNADPTFFYWIINQNTLSRSQNLVKPGRSEMPARMPRGSTMLRLAFALVFIAALTSLRTAQPVAAADTPSCRTVRFADVGWTDIAATTASASVVLQGLGYKTTTQIVSVPVVFLGLKKKDIDVFLGT